MHAITEYYWSRVSLSSLCAVRCETPSAPVAPICLPHGRGEQAEIAGGHFFGWCAPLFTSKATHSSASASNLLELLYILLTPFPATAYCTCVHDDHSTTAASDHIQASTGGPRSSHALSDGSSPRPEQSYRLQANYSCFADLIITENSTAGHRILLSGTRPARPWLALNCLS